MYLVKSLKLTDIKVEISSISERAIGFIGSRIVPYALVWARKRNIYPTVIYYPTDLENTGTDINSYVNVMNCDYKGKMSLMIYLGSTVLKEQKKSLKSKKVESLTRIKDIFDKCPRPKSKVTLIFDSNSKTDVHKIATLFKPDTFNIMIREVKARTKSKLPSEFSDLGYEVVEQGDVLKW